MRVGSAGWILLVPTAFLPTGRNALPLTSPQHRGHPQNLSHHPSNTPQPLHSTPPGQPPSHTQHLDRVKQQAKGDPTSGAGPPKAVLSPERARQGLSLGWGEPSAFPSWTSGAVGTETMGLSSPLRIKPRLASGSFLISCFFFKADTTDIWGKTAPSGTGLLEEGQR